jgi:transglutaminase superfamily protein
LSPLKSVFNHRHVEFIGTNRFLLPLTLLSGSFLLPSAFGDTKWYTVSYAGQKVGYMSSSVEGDLTKGSQRLVFRRLGASITLWSKSFVREDGSGEVLSLRGESSSSNAVTINEGVVTGATMRLKVTTGSKSYERQVPLTGRLLGPAGVAKLTTSGLLREGDSVHYFTTEPSLGLVFGATRTLEAHDDLNLLGRRIESIRVHESIPSVGIDHLVWLDSEGRLLRSEDKTPLGLAVVELANEKAAMLAAEGGTLAAEAYGRSIARTNIRLPDPRSLSRLVIRLTNRRPELGWPTLNSDTQRVLSQSSTEAVVEVRQPSLPKGESLRPPQEGLDEYLAANELLQSDDPGVRRLAKLIVGEERDPWRKATMLRDWEAENMRFDAGVAIAASAEVARDRRGTCFAYSTLLAAMCRVVGIPSRFVMGFGYTNGMFGGHAWVDVRVGERWIPIDAALTEKGPADAARLRCLTSSLASGSADIQSGLQLLGNVDIQVIEYSRNGRTVGVPNDAHPYEKRAGLYRNRWLGIEERMPRSFRFDQLDRVYPDTTIFRAISQDGAVTVDQLPASTYPEGVQAPSEGLAAKRPTLARRQITTSTPKGLKTRRRAVKTHLSLANNPSTPSTARAQADIVVGQTDWRFIATGPNARKTLRLAVQGFSYRGIH